MLGKQTIDLANTSENRGKELSHGTSYQKQARDLMTIDELAVMDGGKCIVRVRGVRPFLSDKFDITKHKHLADYDKKNLFDVQQYIGCNLTLQANDEFMVYEFVQ